MSELLGRRISIIPAMVCLSLFSIGTATSKNIQSVLLTRFFGGIFGSAPVSNVSAALGDIWDPKVRGTAVTFYAVAVVGGPTLVSIFCPFKESLLIIYRAHSLDLPCLLTPILAGAGPNTLRQYGLLRSQRSFFSSCLRRTDRYC